MPTHHKINMPLIKSLVSHAFNKNSPATVLQKCLDPSLPQSSSCTLPLPRSLPHRIHVWYIYLTNLPSKSNIPAGKYSMDGMAATDSSTEDPTHKRACDFFGSVISWSRIDWLWCYPRPVNKHGWQWKIHPFLMGMHLKKWRITHCYVSLPECIYV